MRIRIVLTGPPRVVLGRPAVNLDLPGGPCTLADVLKGLADAEPRIGRYLQDGDGRPPPSLRPLLNDRPLDSMSAISDGAIVTLLYAVAGGSGEAGTVGEKERSGAP